MLEESLLFFIFLEKDFQSMTQYLKGIAVKVNGIKIEIVSNLKIQ